MSASAAAVPVGLELLDHLCRVAAAASPAARGLISTATSGLLGRGWLPSVDSLIETTSHSLDIAPADLRAELPWLQETGLLEIADNRVLSLGCLFATRKTGLTLALDEKHAVDLLGPLAALAAPIALQHAGEIRGRCAQSPDIAFQLLADEEGVHSRDPASVALFLPAWQPGQRPTQVMAAGVFLADDDALSDWQSRHGEPQGMPVLGMFFAMAAGDLGAKLGAALAPLFNHLPDFD